MRANARELAKPQAEAESAVATRLGHVVDGVRPQLLGQLLQLGQAVWRAASGRCHTRVAELIQPPPPQGGNSTCAARRRVAPQVLQVHRVVAAVQQRRGLHTGPGARQPRAPCTARVCVFAVRPPAAPAAPYAPGFRSAPGSPPQSGQAGGGPAVSVAQAIVNEGSRQVALTAGHPLATPTAAAGPPRSVRASCA